MKRYLLFIILILPFFGVSQKRYVSLGFEVTTPCNLYENKTFKQLTSGKVKVVEALVCATEKPNAAVYNLNVYQDDSGSSQKFNTNYQRDLVNSGIAFRKITVSGLAATEYTFTQNGVPAKAVAFYQSGKSYLMQVTTNHNLESRFATFRNSFKKQ